jgi:hypothetical protein
LFLCERSAAQRHDSGGSAAQFPKDMLQGCVFDSTEFGFSRIAKNLRYAAPFPRFDAVVEVFKDPIQPLSEDAAHTALSGSHETNQKDGMAKRDGGRWFGPHTDARRRIHRFARSLRQKSVLAARS